MTDQKQNTKYPKRLWLAGPAPWIAQEAVIIGGSRRRVQFHNGSAVVKNAEEEATVRKALAGNVYDEDLTEAIDHPTSGWHTMSQKAFNAHVRVVGQ